VFVSTAGAGSGACRASGTTAVTAAAVAAAVAAGAAAGAPATAGVAGAPGAGTVGPTFITRSERVDLPATTSRADALALGAPGTFAVTGPLAGGRSANE